MSQRAKHIRFEVLVNGKCRCTAGIPEYGVLSTVVDWVIRHPRRKPKDYTLKQWSGQRLRLTAGGLKAAPMQIHDKHVVWEASDLKLGDEVLVRILGPGPFDSPPKPQKMKVGTSPTRSSSRSKKK